MHGKAGRNQQGKEQRIAIHWTMTSEGTIGCRGKWLYVSEKRKRERLSFAHEKNSRFMSYKRE
jgi:hypothetical protein